MYVRAISSVNVGLRSGPNRGIAGAIAEFGSHSLLTPTSGCPKRLLGESVAADRQASPALSRKRTEQRSLLKPWYWTTNSDE